MHQLFSEPVSSQAAMHLCRFDVPDDDKDDAVSVLHRQHAATQRHGRDAILGDKRNRDDSSSSSNVVTAAAAWPRDVWAFVAYGDQAAAPSRVLARTHRYHVVAGVAAAASVTGTQDDDGSDDSKRNNNNGRSVMMKYEDDEDAVDDAAAAGGVAALAPVDARTPHVCRAMLRQALALIARVVALDTEGYFVTGAAAREDNNSSSGNSGSSGDGTVAAAADVAEEHTLMYLYCLVQSLELQLDDWCRQQGAVMTATAATMAASSTDKNNTDVWVTELTALATRVYMCMDALEHTLLDIVLAQHTTADEAQSAAQQQQQHDKDGSSSSPVPSLSYVSDMLAALPGACAAVAWPCRLLPRARVERGGSDRDNGSGRVACDDSNTTTAATTALRTCVGAATTSVVLRALLDVQQADCCDVLERANDATLTQLAAARTSNNNGAEGTAVTASAAREAPQLATTTFTQLLAKAWLGVYALHGVQAAVLDMRVLFYRLRRQAHERAVTTAAAPSAAGTARKAGGSSRSTRHASTHAQRHTTATTTTLQQQQQQQQKQPRIVLTAAQRLARLDELWAVWCTALRTHLRNVALQHAQQAGRGENSNAALLLDRVAACDEACSVFDLLQPRLLHNNGHIAGGATTDAARRGRDVQARALRVLAHLRRVDAQGWFAVPAFDLVNMDFGSVALWVRSELFARKSSRAAFDALRYALERMVDSCVVRYGPTHEFSLAITQVRQELVSTARREGLLA